MISLLKKQKKFQLRFQGGFSTTSKLLKYTFLSLVVVNINNLVRLSAMHSSYMDRHSQNLMSIRKITKN
jgi:hypothetical protein